MDSASIHTELGRLTEAVGTIKTAMDKRSNRVDEIHDATITLTHIVEKMAPMVEAHETIARGIRKEYLPRLDEHHAHVEMLIQQAAFWKKLRADLIRKGAWFVLACLLAYILHILGLDDYAQKMVGQ